MSTKNKIMIIGTPASTLYLDDEITCTPFINKFELVEENARGNGGSTSYYNIPNGATELGDLIKHKKMEHGIGEAFCALYRLNDNGEYKRNLTKAKFYIEKELEWLEKQASQSSK